MRERIRLIMEAQKMTPARFADSLHIGRAVISHILNGRNNPSLDVVTRILKEIPEINSNWLLTGNGSMYVRDQKKELSASPTIEEESRKSTSLPNLFSQVFEKTVNTDKSGGDSKYENLTKQNQSNNLSENSAIEKIVYQERSPRKIKQIIVCYDDNTFETFGDK